MSTIESIHEEHFICNGDESVRVLDALIHIAAKGSGKFSFHPITVFYCDERDQVIVRIQSTVEKHFTCHVVFSTSTLKEKFKEMHEELRHVEWVNWKKDIRQLSKLDECFQDLEQSNESSMTQNKINSAACSEVMMVIPVIVLVVAVASRVLF